jgi:hypothetical protein
MLGPYGKWLRYGMAGAGVLSSITGIVLVIIVYLTVSPSVGALKANAISQVDGAILAVEDLDRGLAGTYDSMNAIPRFSEDLSLGFRGYAASTKQLADGIESFSEQADAAYGGSGAETLKSAAANLRSSAEKMEGQADSLHTITDPIKEGQAGIKGARDELSKSKSDLSKAKRDIGNAFDALSNAMLLSCAMFALVFIALGAYSAALFL